MDWWTSAGIRANRGCGCYRPEALGPRVMRLLETLWEASDHRCGKRLAAVLPTLVVAIETMVTWRFDRFSRHCCCSGARPRPIGCWHRLALPRTVSNGSGGCGS